MELVLVVHQIVFPVLLPSLFAVSVTVLTSSSLIIPLRQFASPVALHIIMRLTVLATLVSRHVCHALQPTPAHLVSIFIT